MPVSQVHIPLLLFCNLFILTLQQRTNRIQYKVDVRFHIHINHLICLIDDNPTASSKHHVMFLQKLSDPARRPNQNLASLLQIQALKLYLFSSNDSLTTATNSQCQLLKLLRYLLGQLSGWSQYQPIRSFISSFMGYWWQVSDITNQWDQIGQCLTLPCWGESNHILPAEPNRNGLHLYWLWYLKSHSFYGIEQMQVNFGLVPRSDWVGDTTSLRNDIVVFSENPPISLRHFVLLFGRPMFHHLIVFTDVATRIPLTSLLSHVNSSHESFTEQQCGLILVGI